MRLDLTLVGAAFALLMALVAALAGWLVLRFDWFVPFALLAGWYLADMASGLIHMYMDYRPCRPGTGLATLYFYEGPRDTEDYLRLRDAILGRVGPIERLVFDFKNHHPRPDALGRRSMLRLTGSTVIAASLPFALMVNVANLLWPVPGWATALCLAFLIGGTFAQYFHGSLHRDHAEWPVRLLRRSGLLMTPGAHAKHHATLRQDFATNSGWSNPVLNRLFEALMRRGVFDQAGLEPRW